MIHVLLVDDDQGLLKSARQILELHGFFQIETALSVKEAKEKLEQKSYDVIVSDYQMPEKDGLEFLKDLRGNRNGIPFILFTGKGREEVAVKALNLGADRYFNKTGKPDTVYGELAHSVVTAVKASRAEKTLQESEKKYRKQFENAIDAIFLADAETGILVDCNQAATKLVGRKKSELIGKHQRILHPPEATEGEFSRAFAQHRKEELTALEDQIITKSGEIRDVIISTTIFKIEGRRFLQGTFHDITENKKMEEKLRRERQTLELVTENIGAGLTIISKDFKILWANNFLKNIYGKVKGKTCYTVYNDRNSVCLGCGVKKVFETGADNVVHEQLVPTRDGQRIWIELTANPIRDENGNIVAASELTVNANECKQLENKLREAEEKYHSIFNKTPLGILIIDSSGTAVEFNDEAHLQLGYSREEFEKLTISDYEVIETPEETRSHMNKILKTGKDEFETKHRTKTGEIRDIKNTVQVIELVGKKFFQVITQDITEQKRAEEALRESEKKYRHLLNGMNDTAWVIDSDCSLIDVNDAAVKALGYSRKELRSMKIFDIDFSLDPKEIRSLVKNMPKDKIQVFQTTHTTKNGKQIPVEISSSLITYQGKQAVLSIARDITARKEMEKALKESEERFRQIVEQSGIWVWEIDANGLYTYASPVVEEVLGYKPEELVGKKYFYDVFYPDDREELKKAAFKTFSEKKPFRRFLNRNVHKNRKTVWISTNGVPLIDADGNLLGYRGSDKNITEQRMAEEALRENEKKYRLLTENTTDVIYIQDMNLNFTYASPSVEKLSGYTPEELVTLRPDKFMTTESFERGVADFKEVIASAAKDPDYEIPLKQYEYRCKDGSTFWGELKMKLLKDSNNNFVGIQGNLRDITERKEAEEKLDKMMNKLVTINEKLGVIGKLTRHDARNKLSVIANNSYLAKQKLATNPGAIEFVDDIESAIDQMEKIFDFARNYELLGVEELSYLDVKKYIDEAVILISGLDTVNVVNECQGLTVLADSLLRQLFYNLVENTLKYGEKVTTIRLYYAEGKNELKLVYEDDGVGIPKNEKEKIFQEGYGKGTGYGLYLIKKICEAYCWTIKETGVPGKGAQFVMTIPKTNTDGLPLYHFE